MKRRYIRLLVLTAVALAIGWLTFAKVSASSAEQDGPKEGGQQSALVTTQEVAPTTVYDTLAAIGTLRPDEAITVRNETPGKVISIDFEEGERVDKGQQLVQMRNDTLRAQLRVQQRRRDLLETEVERREQVLDQGGVSRHEYDASVNELEIARAELDRIRAQIDETVVRAPFDGVIGIRSVSPGAVLTTGADIAELRKIDTLDLEFTVPERFAGRVETGQQVRFRVHGSDEIHRAQITTIEPGLESSNRALRVQAKVDNADGTFHAGAFAQVRVVLDAFEDVLTVPAPAIVQSEAGPSVWLNDDGRAVEKEVTTGQRNAKRVEIASGIEPGDEVIVTGRQGLQPGMPLELDTSENAMDPDAIAPDQSTTGRRNQWFSQKDLEEALLEEENARVNDQGADTESEGSETQEAQ